MTRPSSTYRTSWYDLTGNADGVGKALLERCLERFKHVRHKVLLTDAQPAQHDFYNALGFRDIRDVTDGALHAFVQIEGL